MKQLIYKIIYNKYINKILRNINKVFYPILFKKVRIHPSGSIHIKTVEGKTLKIKSNQTSYVTRDIFWDGYQNFEYTHIFSKLIKKISVFYDMGANIGYYSLLAILENKNIKVISFEPATGPLFYFRENVAINNFKNIRIESLALSHKQGEIVFYEVKNKKYTYLQHNLSGESNTKCAKTKNSYFVKNKVKTTTLDEYVEQYENKKIDLTKIDTEGTEHLILSRSRNVLNEPNYNL